MDTQQPASEGPRDGSVTQLLGDLKSGDPAAVQALWERYFSRLVLLARGRLRRVVGPGGIEDEEDAVLSAFDSFVQGLQRERFPRLSDRHNLWQLLVTITTRKVYDQAERRGAEKRGGGYQNVSRSGAGEGGGGLEWLVGAEPTPEFAALVADQCRVLLGLLSREDPTGERHLREVAVWKMEGFTNAEIADRLGCALRTVANRLDLIRSLWKDAGSA